jgi:hypothetical protein
MEARNHRWCFMQATSHSEDQDRTLAAQQAPEQPGGAHLFAAAGLAATAAERQRCPSLRSACGSGPGHQQQVLHAALAAAEKRKDTKHANQLRQTETGPVWSKTRVSV